MKAMLIYSRLTGSSNFLSHLDYIKEKLEKKFDKLTIVETKDKEEFKKQVLLACKSYDYLLFVGGDGAVNSVLNFIAEEDKKPILGYVPGGTTCDFAHNFKLSKNIKRAIKNICEGEAMKIDICKANNTYFSYVLACGAFSEISYTAKRKYKKHMGNLAYYLIAVRDAFIPRKVHAVLECNNKKYNIVAPFFMCLNSNHVGGFYVNLKNVMNDGKFHLFITKPGMFNGLIHYVFFKARTLKILTNEFKLTFKNRIEEWCVDGEHASLGNVYAKVLPQHVSLIIPKKVVNKLRKTEIIDNGEKNAERK